MKKQLKRSQKKKRRWGLAARFEYKKAKGRK